MAVGLTERGQGRPRGRAGAAIGRLWVIVIAIPAAILLGTLATLGTDSHERALVRATASNTLQIETVRLDLERLLAGERAARLTHDPAILSDIRNRFELTRVDLARALARSPAHPPTVAAAVATLAALLPVHVGAGSLVVGVGGRAVERADHDLDDTLRTVLERRRTLLVATARNRWIVVATVGAASIVLLVLLLVGLQNFQAIRRDETLEAARLAHAIRQMPNAVAVFDEHDRLRFWNERLSAMHGVPSGEIRAGLFFTDLVRALAEAAPAVFVPARPDRPLDGNAVVAGRALEIHRAPMPGGGQLLAITDNTRRVEAEAVAAQAQKMEVLGRLTGGIAHDFNNLLQALDANVAVLGSEKLGSAGSRIRLEAVADAIDRGARLTRHLLAFARRQELTSTAIATGALLESMADLLARTLGDDIVVTVELAADLWSVLGDRAPLENALLNIALNARDAMPDGGELSIRARNVPAADGAGFVRIGLTDNGIGMSDEERERAIEPFWTTKDSSQGTGLGLSLVHGYAAQSGGRLEIESRKGDGTTVALVLPRASTAPVAPVPSDAVVLARGETVLLVEDDRFVRDATRAALEQLGYRVEEAVDADAAALLFEHGARPDLLFSDIMMPGRIGVAALIDRARAVRPALPVLLHSGDPEAAARAGVSLDARTVLLGKPWRYAELSRVLRSLLTVPAAATLDRAGTVLPG